MSLQSHTELNKTREKLRLLEAQYQKQQGQSAANEHAQELSLRSLKRLINQLKEEIARFESQHSTVTKGD